MTDHYFVYTDDNLDFDHDIMRDDRDGLVRLLCEIRDKRADLAAAAKDVERDLLALADEKRWVVEGLGEVEVKKSNSYKNWDNDGLTRRLVALALDERIVDPETGEYEPAWEAVARVLSACARPSWRVTPLRDRGLAVDEWCSVESEGWSIKLPPRA